MAEHTVAQLQQQLAGLHLDFMALVQRHQDDIDRLSAALMPESSFVNMGDTFQKGEIPPGPRRIFAALEQRITSLESKVERMFALVEALQHGAEMEEAWRAYAHWKIDRLWQHALLSGMLPSEPDPGGTEQTPDSGSSSFDLWERRRRLAASSVEARAENTRTAAHRRPGRGARVGNPFGIRIGGLGAASDQSGPSSCDDNRASETEDSPPGPSCVSGTRSEGSVGADDRLPFDASDPWA